MRDTRRTRVVLALLLLTAFTLITLDYRSGDHGAFRSLRDGAATVFGPVEHGVASVVRPVRNAFAALGSAGDQKKKIDALQSRVDDLQRQLRERPFDEHRLAQQDKLLHMLGAGQYRSVPAQVIATGAGRGFEWTATINVGSRDGVKPDMTVLDGDGLVGRVKYVGHSTSVVLLAIDPQSSVGVKLADGETGVVTGHGSAPMSFYLFNPQARVNVGDGFVTAGSKNQTPYVWGVPVGSIKEVDASTFGSVKRGTVEPFADFSSLDLVAVVVEPPTTDPHAALLPDRPVPSTTPLPGG